MKSLIIAMQFLTPIPLKISVFEPKDLARSMRWFPLVGFGIGVFLVLIKIACLSLGFSAWVTATLLLLMLTVASGGLHLDGLSDVCDGFYAGKTKEEVLKIMRDPHIGVTGVIGVVFILLLKWSLLASFPLGNVVYSNVTLILIPVLSRWAMVIAARMGPYAPVAQEGTGKVFVENISAKELFIATVIVFSITFILSFLSFYSGMYLLMCASFIVVLVMVKVSRKILGGITGDILGAINEITEILVLFLAYWICIVR